MAQAANSTTSPSVVVAKPEEQKTSKSAASLPLLQMESPRALAENVADWSKNFVGNCAIKVIDCNLVHFEWQSWLDRAFQNVKTHNALLYLLINGIQDKRFVDQSALYGMDLISHAVVQKSVIDSSSKMTVDVLINEPRVVKSSLDLCIWFV